VQELGPRAVHATASTAVTDTASMTATAGSDDALAATATPSTRKRKPSAKAQAAAVAAAATEQQVQAVHGALQRAQEQLAAATVYNTSTSTSSSNSGAVQGEVNVQEYSSAAAEVQALVHRVRELLQPTVANTAAVSPGACLQSTNTLFCHI
jgi:hypothetical protein